MSETPVPLPSLTVRPSDRLFPTNIEFEEFSMWNPAHAKFYDPPRRYRPSFIKWLEEQYSMYFVDLKGPYIYLRAMAIPDPPIRPFKIAGRIVVWLSPSENASITYAGTLQKRAVKEIDPEAYEQLIPYLLPEPDLLEEIMMTYFGGAKALTYLGDHLVVEMPKPDNGLELPVPSSYHRLRFQIPVSFTYGPLFERGIFGGRPIPCMTNSQSTLVRLGTRSGNPSSWYENNGPVQYNEDVFISKLSPGHQVLSCQGRRVVRRDRDDASDTTQFWTHDIFATNYIYRGEIRRSSSNSALRRTSRGRAPDPRSSSLMLIENPVNTRFNYDNNNSNDNSGPNAGTSAGRLMSNLAYEQSLMRRNFNFAGPSFYNDAYETQFATV